MTNEQPSAVRSRDGQLEYMIDATVKAVCRNRSDYPASVYRAWLESNLNEAEQRGAEAERRKAVELPRQPSDDTLKEQARTSLKRWGWRPGMTLRAAQVVGLMVDFARSALSGEMSCDWPECGCCDDARCADAGIQRTTTRLASQENASLRAKIERSRDMQVTALISEVGEFQHPHVSGRLWLTQHLNEAEQRGAEAERRKAADVLAENARLRGQIEDLREALCVAKGALSEVVDGASQQYQARNGRWVTIMADDGERCDIIHSDVTLECGAALRRVDTALASSPAQGGGA